MIFTNVMSSSTATKALARSFRASALKRARPCQTRFSSSSASASSTTSWSPVIPPGTLAAYDEALAFLSSHSDKVRQQLASVDSTPSLTDSDKQQLKESLHIASQVNDPAILSSFTSQDAASYDASNPTFRHLREKLWRKSGVLDRIMQRVQLMHVMPDVLPAITPTVDVQVAFGTGSGFTDHTSEGGDVTVGCMLDPVHSVELPKINITSFHPDMRRYTLLMVDPDSPSSETQSFKTKVHALKSGIERNATTLDPVDLQSGMELSYIPPHPQAGTPYHRYTVLVFEEGQESQTYNPLTEEQLDDINVTDFAQERQLTPAGIHFWREEWSKEAAGTVSSIYSDILRKFLVMRPSLRSTNFNSARLTETLEPAYRYPPRASRIRKELGDLGSKWY